MHKTTRSNHLILIVDKDVKGMLLNASILRASGYKIITTQSSARALELTANQKPDLILLEIDIEGMDGIDTCRMLRERHRSGVPIIIQSKINTEDVILRAFEAGATDYLIKPTPEGILKAKLQVYLKQPTVSIESPVVKDNEVLIGETHLGNYHILEKLGGGSSANVYRAQNKTTHEIVAIKFLNKKTVGNEKDIQRFFRGSLIGLELPRHPHIVQIFEIKKTEHYIYQIMEYVSGRTLHQIIKSGHRISESEAVKVLTDITSALEHLHQNQVIHRDVKPGNIFITEKWHCKLGDMGISRRIIDRTATAAGHVVGTPGYIAPEQVLDMKPIDIRVDIYALGLTLFHAATGSNPFDRETTYASIIARLEGPELSLTQKDAPRFSNEFRNLISRMIRRRPELRFESPSSLLSALHTYRDMQQERET